MSLNRDCAAQADEQLFELYLRTKDQDAFAVLYERHFDNLVDFVYRRYIHNHTSAEDVAQQTFVRLIQYGETYNANEPFNKWLYTVAGNFALTESETTGCQKRGGRVKTFRLDRGNHNHDEPEADTLDNREGKNEFDCASSDGVAEVYDHKAGEKRRFDPAVVFESLDNLTAEERQVITLRYYEGKAEREIADEMGVSRHQVRLLKKSAIQRLRAPLASSQLV